MKELIGRLIAYVFLGSFCLAGPLLLIVALATAGQRVALLTAGLRAEGVVIGAAQTGSTRITYAPVFQFTASDGRSYTVNSDVFGKESTVRRGERLEVLYWPAHPEAARINGIAELWTLPLVAGVVGTGFSVVPAMMLLAWMRRRAGEVAPERQAAASMAADAVSLGFRRTLGVVLIGAGAVLLAMGLGIISTDPTVKGSRILATAVGVLLVGSGVLLGQWVATGSRLSNVFGGLVGTSMAVMFGWVAVFGEAENFHGGVSIGGVGIDSSGSAGLGRVMFALAAILTALFALWAWKQVFRAR